MDGTIESLVVAILSPVLLALAGALGGWVLTKLPGPLRERLLAGVHQKDMQLLTDALLRRALAITAGAVSPNTATADLAAYVRRSLPETVAKLAPSDDALKTMAAAALKTAMNQSAKPAPPGG